MHTAFDNLFIGIFVILFLCQIGSHIVQAFTFTLAPVNVILNRVFPDPKDPDWELDTTLPQWTFRHSNILLRGCPEHCACGDNQLSISDVLVKDGSVVMRYYNAVNVEWCKREKLIKEQKIQKALEELP